MSFYEGLHRHTALVLSLTSSAFNITKNEIDSLIYSTEKSLKEHSDKLDDATKAEVEKAIEEARLVKDSDDLEVLKARTSALSESSMKMGQAIYGRQQQQEGGGSADDEAKDDKTVDADYEEKKDDKGDKK